MPAGITLSLGIACLFLPVPSLTPRQVTIRRLLGVKSQQIIDYSLSPASTIFPVASTTAMMIVQSSIPIFFSIANLDAIRAHTNSTAMPVIVAFVAIIVGPRFWAKYCKFNQPRGRKAQTIR